MWRRESGLAEQLFRNSRHAMGGLAGSIKEKMLEGLRHIGFSSKIHTMSLTVFFKAIDLHEDLAVQIEVHNGLSRVDPAKLYLPPLNSNPAIPDSLNCGIRSVELLRPTSRVRGMQPINADEAKICSGILQVTPRLHNLTLREPRRKARTAECRLTGLSPIKNGRDWILKRGVIRSNLSLLSKLAFRRMSLDIQKLDSAEYRGFLNEAEVLRSIPIDRSELLAVFRSVPIEIISRLQYVSDVGMLLYSVSNQPQRKQTRLHDLAAIRDISDNEIYLIPHRAKYVSVSLADC
jgi:hypothetical protein